MQSMVLPRLAAALLLTVSSAAIGQGLTPDQRAYYRAQLNGGGYGAVAPARRDAVGDALVSWNRLRQSDSYSFADYANFMIANPGWPGQDAMRKTAEKAIDTGTYAPTQVTGYFSRFPALTTTGEAKHAYALLASGRQAEARDAAKRAWTGGALGPQDEARVLSLFGSAFTSDDHDRRMDRLLWEGQTQSASRQLGYASPAKRPLFAARLAMQTRAPNASALASALDPRWREDPGLIVDRAGYLRKTGNSAAARALLAQPRRLTQPPVDAEEWFETLLTNARAAANDRQWSVAYNIGRQLDDAYAPGVLVRDRPIGERDDYTSLAWLAGTTALQQLGRPGDAVPLFQRYASAARSPQTQSKGFYWAGRAAQAAGRGPEATNYFTQAAQFGDQFYGQLARERLNLPLTWSPAPLAVPPSDAERAAFNGRTVIRATKLIGEIGSWRDQTAFLRQITQDAKTLPEHYFAAELSREIRRPDLGVMIGRSAGVNGHGDPLRVSFPTVSLPSGYERDFTMIHAITRQESQFDREAVSHAGARGLMQLMPSTARETSGKIGTSYSLGSLTSDTQYNIRLGSSYFQRMLSYYGGSYPLAVAAYNAGPGNVNKWIAANGDPRRGGIDIIDWIEAIPIYETRNYVQRVLENAVVYDAMHPDKARSRGSRTPLSWYLGKRSAG